jgi:hypothetical protein
MVAARSKAWTVFACSNMGVVGSNLTRDTDVCVRLYVEALRWADPPIKESYRLCIGLRICEAAKAQQRAVEP